MPRKFFRYKLVGKLGFAHLRTGVSALHCAVSNVYDSLLGHQHCYWSLLWQMLPLSLALTTFFPCSSFLLLGEHERVDFLEV